MSQTNSLYLNRPQMLVQACQATRTVAILPRGGGKSSGVGPNWFTHRVKLMPGGASGIVGSTYKQLLSRTLPPFLGTLRKMGYVEGIDYVIGKRPPEMWEAKAIVPPQKFDDVVSWANGHTTYLVSQDRAGSPNSLSLQFNMKDEARFMNKERLDEDFEPTMRGNKELFGHLPEYLSELIMSDQPTSAAARWILEYEKDHDEQLIAHLVNLYADMQRHLRQMDGDLSARRYNDLRRSYNNLKAQYDRLRMGKKLPDGTYAGSTLFIEGSVMDNIHVLGMEAIMKMKRTMTPLKFNVSILGKRMKQVIGSFYPDLDDSKHYYAPEYNYAYLRTLNLVNGDQPDWRQDAELNTSLPFHIGSDHGASYNGIKIGQLQGNTLKVINHLYVLDGGTTEDVAYEFCKYYKNFPSNEVYFYYDHTHIATSGKANNITFVDEFVNKLKDEGWNVHAVYLGHTPAYSDRFNLWSKCLRGAPDLPRIQFHQEKCETLFMAMQDTKAKAGRIENSIAKDKKDERNASISQDKTTHGPDGADILLWGVVNPEKVSTNSNDFLGMMTSR